MALTAKFTPDDASGVRNIMIFDYAGKFHHDFVYRQTENQGLEGNYMMFLSKVSVPETIRIVVTTAIEATILTARNLKGTLVTGNGTFTTVRLLNARTVRGLNQSSVSVVSTITTPVFDYAEMTTTWIREAT